MSRSTKHSRAASPPRPVPAPSRVSHRNRSFVSFSLQFRLREVLWGFHASIGVTGLNYRYHFFSYLHNSVLVAVLGKPCSDTKLSYIFPLGTIILSLRRDYQTLPLFYLKNFFFLLRFKMRCFNLVSKWSYGNLPRTLRSFAGGSTERISGYRTYRSYMYLSEACNRRNKHAVRRTLSAPSMKLINFVYWSPTLLNAVTVYNLAKPY